MSNEPIIGASVPRKEGRDKVTGRAQYVDDMVLPDMLYGATVRSQIPRGKIKKITFGPGIDWDEFVIVSAKDIPGKNCIALIIDDQPCLADGLRQSSRGADSLACPSRSAPSAQSSQGGLDRIRAASCRSSRSKKASNIPKSFGERTTFSKPIWSRKGDVDDIGARADHIVEGEYDTGAQEQLYIENNGVIAAFDPQQGVTLWGSLQCPYYVHKALMALCNLPAEQIRVVQMETGGAFGGKEEYPSMIAGHAALLAMKSGKPVKIIYDRMEDMAATTKRHPSRTRHRTAVSRNGKILGGEIDFTIDGGAYATLSSVVLSRGTIHAGGPYYWPNVRIRAKAVATNAPPHGAFRGFGAPQSLFAMERHMDRIAEVSRILAARIRRRNFLKPGGPRLPTNDKRTNRSERTSGTGLELSDYHAKKQVREEKMRRRRSKKEWALLRFCMARDSRGRANAIWVPWLVWKACADGSVRVLVSSTEFGQGTKTVLCQIAAEALGLRYDDVGIAQPDTQDVPNSGPTVRRGRSWWWENLVQSAAIGIRQTLAACGMLGESYSPEEFRSACRAYVQSVTHSVAWRAMSAREMFSGTTRNIGLCVCRVSRGRSISLKSQWI